MKLCECGCGQPAPIATQNKPSKGHVKGEPMRFISGHNSRGLKRSAETRQRMSEAAKNRDQSVYCGPRGCVSRAPKSIHVWLRRWHPKSGICEECGRKGHTDLAFLRHPEPYTLDRADYRELCRSCHSRLDVAMGQRPDWRDRDQNPRYAA